MHKDRNELSCCQMDNLCAHESFLLDLHHHHRGNICTPSFIQEWMQKKKKLPETSQTFIRPENEKRTDQLLSLQTAVDVENTSPL